MRLDRQKCELVRARSCLGSKDIEKAGIPKGTLCRILSGKEVRPETLGRLAKALGVDVTDILADN